MRVFQITVLALVFSIAAVAGTPFKATTTLTAETSNNTSTANTFTTQTNGNIGAANVSKLPVRSLMYADATSKVYVNFLPWFGFGDHMNVGYASNDVTQVQKQVADMMSRGIDGAIIDWYGQGKFNQHFVYYDQASTDLMHEAELHPGFNFAIMDDAVSLKACAATAGCDVTQTLINDLTYAYNTYENSPAYQRYNNQPVVYFFGQEFYNIDWARVRASVPGNPMFIFRNPGGFSYSQSNGAFSWAAPETVSSTDPMALKYLDYYDSTALSKSPTYSLASSYKGFNDSLAAWTQNRLIDQQCGQTWLQTMAEAGKYYSAAAQTLGVQIVTWNDYEEGTELESGIDNCVTVTAAATGTVISWSITGQANTLDHYTVFLSQDGENLMWLADVPVMTNSLDLAQFSLNSGGYTAYVKATGKASFTNKMSAAVSVAVPNQPPVTLLSVSPGSGTAPVAVTASTAGSSDSDGFIAGTVINFGDGSTPVSAATASHIYSVAGIYLVTATVTDNLGASSSQTATVMVVAPNIPPVAALSVTPASAYGPITVTASTAGSSDPDGTVVGSSINFGDGAVAAGLSATHTYSTTGVYIVTATVTDNQGASSATTSTVTVKAPEVIVSSPSSGATLTSPVRVVATGSSGNLVTAMQIYLDGALVYTVNSANLDKSISIAGGTHSLVVKGWDSAGRSFMKTLTVMVPVNQPPVATLSLSSGSILVGASVTASTAGSSDPDGTIAATSIDFGDGTVVNTTNASHQYRLAGTYTVKATVTDNMGATSSASSTVTVKPPFVAISSPTNGTVVGSPVLVAGSSSSGYAVVATQVYLDGVLKYQTTASSVSISLPLGSGTHVITVQGWDASGATFKSQITVKR